MISVGLLCQELPGFPREDFKLSAVFHCCCVQSGFGQVTLSLFIWLNDGLLVRAFLESLPVTLLYSKADFRPEVLKPPERMRRTLERSPWAEN